jgi:hypothetical protein
MLAGRLYILSWFSCSVVDLGSDQSHFGESREKISTNERNLTRKRTRNEKRTLAVA